MTKKAFPEFRYHPEPLATGSVIESSQPCDVCNRSNGYLYDGPVYSSRNRDAGQVSVCPWCIADGSANRRLDVAFVVDGRWTSDLPMAVVDVIRRRTPGFTGWDREKWLSCHSDAAVFLGPCGFDDLTEHGDAAVEAVRSSFPAALGPDEVESALKALDRDTGPTAYLFRCRHCDTYLAYTDTDEG